MKRWTKEEIKFLRTNHLNRSYYKIAKKLNRTENAIDSKLVRLCIRSKYSICEKIPPLNGDFAYLIGVLLGDGYFCYGFSIEFSKDADLTDYIISKFKKVFNKSPIIRYKKRENGKQISTLIEFNSLKLERYLRRITDNKKRIPKAILSNNEWMMEFVKGFFDCDGVVSNVGQHIAFSQGLHRISWIEQIKNFLSINQIVCGKIVPTRPKGKVTIFGKTRNSRGEIKLYVSHGSFKRFNDLIGSRSERKQNIMNNLVNHVNIHGRPYLWLKPEVVNGVHSL